MNTRFPILFHFAVLIVLSAASFAQEKGVLYGNATDKYTQEPVAGASIMVKGSNEGTFTDSSGNPSSHGSWEIVEALQSLKFLLYLNINASR